jgi:hypothetical protein
MNYNILGSDANGFAYATYYRAAIALTGGLNNILCNNNIIMDEGPVTLHGLNSICYTPWIAGNIQLSNNMVATTSGLTMGMMGNGSTFPAQSVVQGIISAGGASFGAGGISVNLQEWRSVSGAVLASISATGILWASGVNAPVVTSK